MARRTAMPAKGKAGSSCSWNVAGLPSHASCSEFAHQPGPFCFIFIGAARKVEELAEDGVDLLDVGDHRARG